MKLDRELSAYLDCLRFLAALAVLLGHMQLDGLYMSWMPLSRFSHEAVVVFFVLSGMIIYTTTAAKNISARDYIVARSSRIYSVALPAIIFSILAALLVPSGFEEGGAEITNFKPFSWLDIVSSLLFLNESWLNPAALTMNVPYWSLCYEVWYYVLFGVYYFAKGAVRWILLAILACIAGPAILMLFPIWLGGAWLAKNNIRFVLTSTAIAWLTLLGGFAVIAAINIYGIDVSIKVWLRDYVPGLWRVEASQRIVTDYFIGLIIMLNIVSFPGLSIRFREFFGRNKDLFSYFAGFSFTLYLFHRPITQLAGYFFPNDSKSIIYAIVSALLILLACLAISYVTERQLNHWRQAIARFF